MLEKLLAREIDAIEDEKLIIDYCQEAIIALQPEFLASLQNIVKMATETCDYILHCSGRMDEMQLICDIV